MSDPDESTDDEFFSAIGVAITLWQNVEADCAFLFESLLATKNGGAASAIFYHIKNQSTRLELLNIAARFFLTMPEQENMRNEWAALSDRIKEAFSIRNRIAHFVVDETMTPTAWKFELKPQLLDFGQYDMQNVMKSLARRKSKSLRYSQIVAAADQFRTLAVDLNRFARRVFALAHPEFDEQSGPPDMPPLPK